MNQLTTTIKSVENEDNILLVIVEVANTNFTALEKNATAIGDLFYKIHHVTMRFSETAMSLCKNLSGSLSIRNRFPSVVTDVKNGKLLTTVTLDFNGHQLTSIITTNAANELDISIGDIVEGLVKTSDISLIPVISI